jgi:pleiotropic regulator 1
MCLHPGLDMLFSGSRDKTVKMWDIRTKAEIRTFTGHTDSITALASQINEPNLVSGSADTTIKCYDITSGKCMTTLTHHNKPIKSIIFHPEDYCFITASANQIKIFNCPQAQFLRNINLDYSTLDNNIANTDNLIFNNMCIDNDGNNLVMASSVGYLNMFKYKSGYNYQSLYTNPVSGSLIQSENSILSNTFDITGTRLITGSNDKTIKFYKQHEGSNIQHHTTNNKKLKLQ